MLTNNNPNEPLEPGSSFKSNTVLAANTGEVVFSPASNVRGAVVWMASLSSLAASTHAVTLLAKTSAPTSVIDGDILMQGKCSYNGTYDAEIGDLLRPYFVPAGKGLYFVSNVAENNALRSVSYDLLP